MTRNLKAQTYQFHILVFTLLVAIIFMAGLALAQTDSPVSGPRVSIRGKTFYKDGSVWTLKGVTIIAFGAPYSIEARSAGVMKARSHWGAAELKGIKTKLGVDTVRFQVSQPALDPQSSIYDPAYLSEFLKPVRLARASGFVVILSMNAQAPSGIPNLTCMPNDSTVRAWQTITPAFAYDQGVMLELFNEPCKSSKAQTKSEWAQSMQTMIDTVRGLGSTNILLLDGLWWARSTNGLFPLVHDTLPKHLALSVHPYLCKGFSTQKQWQNQFGASTAKYPLIATEWNATPTNGCVGSTTPDVALSLIRYLQSLNVGLVEWGIGSPHGKIVKDYVNYEPTDYASFTDCSKQPSDSGGGQLLANYPNN